MLLVVGSWTCFREWILTHYTKRVDAMDTQEYTYSQLLEDFIRFEYDQNFFDKTINGVYVWYYLRFFIYNIVRNRKVANHITHAINFPKGKKGHRFSAFFERNIRRNILFAAHKDALIIAHGRKIEDEDGYFRDWNTGYINEKLSVSHYLLDRYLSNEYFYPCRMDNLLEYHLYRFGRIKHIKTEEFVVDKNVLYDLYLNPIENKYNFLFTVKEKNMIYGYANARVRDNELMTLYAQFVLKRINPKVVILGMITDSIMQVFCEVAHELNIPSVYLQEGVSFESIDCYYYDPVKNGNRYFCDYMFCYGDYEKDLLTYLPIDKEHVIPVGFPELEEYGTDSVSDDERKKNIMVVSSGTSYLAQIAGELSEMLDDTIYTVLYKIHPMEIVNYEREIFPIAKEYPRLVILGKPENLNFYKSTDKGPTLKAFRYFGKMEWVVGAGSTALFEATKFKKKIAIVDQNDEIQSPLLEKQAAIKVRSAKELANIIVEDSFVPNFDYRFYCDNAIENINSEIEKIICDRKRIK